MASNVTHLNAAEQIKNIEGFYVKCLYHSFFLSAVSAWFVTWNKIKKKIKKFHVIQGNIIEKEYFC